MDKKSIETKILSKGFTLVEVMIVVAILGILAAIVMPEVQGYTQKAKEAAAKDNLRILRETIARYAAEHKDVPPGYLNDNPTATPTGLFTKFQLEDGYLSEIPKNPFNGLNTINAISNSASFPSSPNASTGWIYKPSTKEIRLNYSGTDTEGKTYFSY